MTLHPTDAMFNQTTPLRTEPPWPAWVKEFRAHQSDAIEDIVDAYERGVDVVFLDAPVGSGKTLTAEGVRRWLGVQGVYVCSGKDLQDQFLRDFDYSATMKGRANYATALMPMYTTADCQGRGCKWCPSVRECPYQEQKGRAQAAAVGVLNSAYFLRETSNPRSGFRGRELVVVDECDTMEKVLMGTVEFRMRGRALNELGLRAPVKGARVKTIKGWLEGELRVALAAKLEKLTSQGTLLGLTVEVIREKKRLEDVMGRARTVALGLAGDGDEEDSDPAWGDWIRDYDDRYPDDLILKPVRVGAIGPSMLWKKGKRWLMMSGSVGGVEGMEELVSSLGLDGTDLTYELVEVPMTFPVEHRPIFYQGVANMTYATQAEEFPKLVKKILEVLDKHPDENVLCHTVSYRLAEQLVDAVGGREQLGSRRVMTYRTAEERERVLGAFIADGGVMFAPSLDRGIDLAGDLCRVNIVAKIPFPHLGNRQVSERLRGVGGQLWYSVQVARTLIQMTGRSTRSDTDYSWSYILDGQFGRFWGGEGRRLMPGYWKESLQ